MYIPHHYENTNVDEIKAFVKENGFGILVNQTEGKPWATHIPLELEQGPDGKDYLVGHLAKSNPQSKTLTENQEILCIFNGPHTYISASWYNSEEVPTWDYIAVHVYGKPQLMSEAETMESLHRLVDKYEEQSENPISLHDMSPKTLRQVKGVVGFKIAISKIQAAYKLSQTRPEDHENIKAGLRKRKDANSQDIAERI